MTLHTPFLATLTALALAACQMVLDPAPAPAHSSELACVLDATARPGGGTRLEARVESPRAVSLSYDLRVDGPGLAIHQSGDRSLAAGESAVLGETTTSASPADLDAEFAITVDGRRVACPRG